MINSILTIINQICSVKHHQLEIHWLTDEKDGLDVATHESWSETMSSPRKSPDFEVANIKVHSLNASCVGLEMGWV